MTTTIIGSPFGFLSPARLRALAAFFAADGAARSVTIDHDGVAVTVTERNLRTIHQLDPSRFGRRIECPYCEAGE